MMFSKVLLGLGVAAATIADGLAFTAPLSSKFGVRRMQNVEHTPSCLSFTKPQSQFGHGRGSLQTLFMGWGPDPIWEDATVVSNDRASESCVSVTLKLSPETVEGFKVPGQYCQVKFSTSEDDKPIFLAVASPPPATSSEEGSDSQFEFLIKKTDNNGWITDTKPGAVLQCSQIMGGGFPMEENFEGFKYDFPTQNVLLFAAGSGIAPIRSAIESGQLNTKPAGEGGRTARLYYGVRSTADMPYKDRFGKWELSGVEVVPVVSSPADDYQGRSGYVQTALEEDGVPIPRNSGALMCGMKGMAEAVKSILSDAGMFEGRILTNF